MYIENPEKLLTTPIFGSDGQMWIGIGVVTQIDRRIYDDGLGSQVDRHV